MSTRFREVADGVYQITLSRPSEEITSEVHSYLIRESGDRFIMVDSGWVGTSAELIDTINDRLGQIAITKLLLTHLHPDHFGGAVAVAKRFSAGVSYHSSEVLLTNYQRMFGRGAASPLGSFGVPKHTIDYVRETFTRALSLLPRPSSFIRDGMSFEAQSGRWRAMHTPGHTPGHVSFYHAERGMLISGDHLLAGETPNVAYCPIPGYNALKSYLASLALVAELSPSLVLPAHGKTLTDPRARIRQLYVHHKERVGQVFAGLRDGDGSVMSAASAVEWSRGSFEAMGEFNKWLAMMETMSHLEFLAYCGVARRERGPRRRYSLARKDMAPAERLIDQILLPSLKRFDSRS